MKHLLLTIPCHNEALVITDTLNAVLSYARKNCMNYSWKILVIDNASTDTTYPIVEEIARNEEKIILEKCPMKGRGAALRTMWSHYPEFDIYAYMDADLSTDISSFKPLIDTLDTHDIAIGSRYLPQSQTTREWHRKFYSRIYNALLHLFLKINISDCQCGFKAFSHKSLTLLLSQTTDTGWFWDTEILLLAKKAGLSIKEIPVVWKEKRNKLRQSTVSPWKEVLHQLKNIYKTRKRINTLYKS